MIRTIVARELEDRCKELESILQDVLIAVQKMQKTQYFLKELFTTTAVTDEISGYQEKIKKLLSNFMLVTTIKTFNIVAKTGHEVQEIHEIIKAGRTFSTSFICMEAACSYKASSRCTFIGNSSKCQHLSSAFQNIPWQTGYSGPNVGLLQAR
ncbi:hypothetical protein GGX14DRAFT_89857 [Mycena pura]|uniref:Uncharacterized protein n=1 Tax=Mycena pura TaxID=153505 RepID=A0AAD6YE35_9AGAR|nr:hypothetical protein GGX14DRAFT_89857 [Mycena pura]